MVRTVQLTVLFAVRDHYRILPCIRDGAYVIEEREAKGKVMWYPIVMVINNMKLVTYNH